MKKGFTLIELMIVVAIIAIIAAIAKCHREAVSSYIVGAGCEVPRDTPSENVQALRDYARSTR